MASNLAMGFFFQQECNGAFYQRGAPGPGQREKFASFSRETTIDAIHHAMIRACGVDPLLHRSTAPLPNLSRIR
jgi:hypothetical protein